MRTQITDMLGTAPMTACVPVLDLARAKAFYQQKLGLVPKEESGDGLIYECGQGTVFFMYRSEGAGTSKANQACWNVEDLDAEMATLRSRGVKFEDYDMPGLKTVNGVNVGGGMKSAWFKDSEGNILVLGQRI